MQGFSEEAAVAGVLWHVSAVTKEGSVVSVGEAWAWFRQVGNAGVYI